MTFTRVDEEIVLLDTRRSHYLSLNPVGARFWELFHSGETARPAYQSMCLEYRVQSDELERDLLELISQMLKMGVLEKADA